MVIKAAFIAQITLSSTGIDPSPDENVMNMFHVDHVTYRSNEEMPLTNSHVRGGHGTGTFIRHGSAFLPS